MPASELPEIPPETKDWTWVLRERCPQCGLEAGVLTLAEIPAVIRAQVQVWPVVLLRADVRERPEPQVWSPLEYGAHTRDALRLFADRLALILTEDEPTFPDWDPNDAARAGRYPGLDPETVSAEILTAAETLAAAAEAVPPEAVERRGLRSDGAPFTVTTLLQYLVHDLVHHLWDVSGEPPAASALTRTAEALAETRPRADVLREVRASEATVDGGATGGAGPSLDAGAAQAGPVAGDVSAEAPEANAPAGASEANAADAAAEVPSASAEVPATEGDHRPVPPLQAFADRHRRVLGILIAILCAALAVAFATVAAPTTAGSGVRAFLVHWTVPAVWALIGAVAVTWALSVRRQIVNLIAYAAVACWVIYLGARLL